MNWSRSSGMGANKKENGVVYSVYDGFHFVEIKSTTIWEYNVMSGYGLVTAVASIVTPFHCFQWSN